MTPADLGAVQIPPTGASKALKALLGSGGVGSRRMRQLCAEIPVHIIQSRGKILLFGGIKDWIIHIL